MRVLFIVQGEGRGHLTQALAVRGMLQDAGHVVVRVLAGSVRHREMPHFFVEKIGAPIDRIGSPGFSIGKGRRSIRPVRTLVDNVGRVPVFKRSLRLINRAIKRVRPDLVVSFYEPLAGVYQALYRPRVPFVAVGHQYMFEHPVYSFAPGGSMQRAAVTMFTRLTGLGAAWKLALSLYPAPDLPDQHLSVIPPLLRQDALAYGERDAPAEDFFLIYLLNRGYARQVIEWHDRHPARRLECFWDNSDVGEVVRHDETLVFHRLHDIKFLDLMSRCRGLICTAGFESVSEALFLRKPILAVPVDGHYEQRCNAHDVEMLGAGLHGERFDLSLLEEFISRYDPPVDAFRDWVSLAADRTMSVLEAVAAGYPPSDGRARLQTPAGTASS